MPLSPLLVVIIMLVATMATTMMIIRIISFGMRSCPILSAGPLLSYLDLFWRWRLGVRVAVVKELIRLTSILGL